MPRPLFERYPGLRDRVPFEALIDLPSPLEPHRGVWVKRDDRVGGGALRKMEFFRSEGDLLAWGEEGSSWLEALARRRQTRFITWPGRSRRRVHPLPGVRCRDLLTFGVRMLAELPRLAGGSTTLAPFEGSDPVTTLGFVNAAFELAGQAQRGEGPVPDAVFVPMESGGMAAGLALGFGLAGLDVAVHAVRVASPLVARLRNLRALAFQCAWLLEERPRLSKVALERDCRRFASGAPEAREFFRPLDLDTARAARVAACLMARRDYYRTPVLWITGPPPDRALP